MTDMLANVSVGPWLLSGRIGTGGFADVYAATHKDNGKEAAVKVLHAGHVGDKAAFDAINTEYELLKELAIKGIPRASLHSTVRGRPALVMQRLPGTPVHQLIKQHQSIDKVAGLISMIKLVAQLHMNGVLHNDLKPENFLADPGGNVYLVDFGNARRAEAPKGLFKRMFGARKRKISGTPSYMAPELIRGADPSYRSDVYALGACAHYLLTGEARVEASDGISKIRKAATKGAGSISERIARMPRELVQIIDRACAVDPEQRPLDAQAMAHGLQHQIKSGRFKRTQELDAFIKQQVAKKD